jgi:hypothetical protein
MSSRTTVTIDYLPLAGGPSSISPEVSYGSYDDFLVKFHANLALALGGRAKKKRPWEPFGVTAQEHLSPTSVVREHKGYSALFLAKDIRSMPGLRLEDGWHAPQAGVEFLYTISSGPWDVHMTVLRLGMCNPSAFIVCGHDVSLADSVRQAISGSLILTPRAADEVSWDHLKLYKAIPGARCVAGLVGLPIGPLRVRFCAEERIGYPLQTALCRVGS